ncbi:MAG TPA: translesion error-prone DNA polymerase V autoproteolytic subunit [Phycisphaerae bacterium]|nr:translesion error-prone DNA polymerase V autoproteolytic subunit [Phycisphaerae bacterium]
MQLIHDIQACKIGPPRRLALYVSAVEAGFPSPADDYVETLLDLNEHLVPNPVATFFLRVSGDSMMSAGIFDGDLIIVDRAVQPRDGDIVVAALYGELTVKRIRLGDGQLLLEPDNSAYPAIEVPAEADFHIWGVVTHAIHRTKRKRK